MCWISQREMILLQSMSISGSDTDMAIHIIPGMIRGIILGDIGDGTVPGIILGIIIPGIIADGMVMAATIHAMVTADIMEAGIMPVQIIIQMEEDHPVTTPEVEVTIPTDVLPPIQAPAHLQAGLMDRDPVMCILPAESETPTMPIHQPEQ